MGRLRPQTETPLENYPTANLRYRFPSLNQFLLLKSEVEKMTEWNRISQLGGQCFLLIVFCTFPRKNESHGPNYYRLRRRR